MLLGYDADQRPLGCRQTVTVAQEHCFLITQLSLDFHQYPVEAISKPFS